MKPTLIVIGSLAGAVASVPFVVGMKVKEDTQARVEFANQEIQAQAGPQSGIKLAVYRLGWLRSTAEIETRLKIELPNQSPRTIVIPVPLTIEHGPLPGLFGGDTRPGLALVRSDMKVTDLIDSFSPLAEDRAPLEAFRKVLANYPPVRSEMRVAFDGAGEWSVHGESIQITDAACCSSIRWSALTGQGEFSANLSYIKGLFAVDGMEGADRHGYWQMGAEGLKLSLDLKRHPGWVNLGSVGWSLKGLTGAANGQQFKMSGFTLRGESEANGPALRSRFSSRLDAAEGTGPDGVPHQVRWDFGFELNGLDLAATVELAKGIQAMRGDEESPANQAKLKGLMMRLAEQSLKHQPGIKLAPVSLGLDGQQVTGDLEVGLVGADLASLMAEPGRMVSYLKGKARVSLPEALVALAQIDEEQLGILVQQGLIQREGGNLVAEAKLEPGGKLIVNGIPMDLPAN